MNPIEELKQQKQILELRITELKAEIVRRRSTRGDDLDCWIARAGEGSDRRM